MLITIWNKSGSNSVKNAQTRLLLNCTDLLCLAKTWCDSHPTMPGFDHIQAPAYYFQNSSRLGRGCLHSHQDYQLVSGTFRGILMVGAYIRPTTKHLSSFLFHLTCLSCSTALIMGDSNARSTAWDKVSTSEGRQFSTWAAKPHLYISAPH